MIKNNLKYDLYNFAKELWPINRSITGEGVRETLSKIKIHVPNLKIKSVPSGTNVFDWKIPQEWHVNDAWIECPDGEKICEFKKNNLHLIGYSIPINKKLSLNELQKHLFSLPEQPNAIPYVTSYYKKNWGFCLTDLERKRLKEGTYKVFIDSKLFDGVLNYGELLIKGKSYKEIFLSTYICHPSMANNELSGPTVTTFLSKWVSAQKDKRFSYRIIFIPETIGSITYLSKNLDYLKKNVIAGFNITCVGDNRSYSFLPTRKNNTLSDKVGLHVLKNIDQNFKTYSWKDRGSDERQYCAPLIDLPIASIMRTKYGEYVEYHTSLDDLKNVVTPEGLCGGYNAIKLSIEAIENNYIYKTQVYGEPQMSKRGLYPEISKKSGINYDTQLIMDVLSQCDGISDLISISERCDVPIWEIYDIIKLLLKHDLIRPVKDTN